MYPSRIQKLSGIDLASCRFLSDAVGFNKDETNQGAILGSEGTFAVDPDAGTAFGVWIDGNRISRSFLDF